MSHLNENCLKKYENFDPEDAISWVSRMSPMDVVVMKNIIKNTDKIYTQINTTHINNTQINK